MADDDTSLSDEERVELEQLRAEKAERETAQRRSRTPELERLKADKAASEADLAERGASPRPRRRAQLMEVDENDDDLKMPVGQDRHHRGGHHRRGPRSHHDSLAKVTKTSGKVTHVSHRSHQAHRRLPQHRPLRAHDGSGLLGVGLVDGEACFNAFFRRIPSGAMPCLRNGQIADLVENFVFEDDDIEYLAAYQAPGGGPMFKGGFLEYLRNHRLDLTIHAIPG